MNWKRPVKHGKVEISNDEMFGIDDLNESGFKHNKCIKYKRKQRPDFLPSAVDSKFYDIQ